MNANKLYTKFSIEKIWNKLKQHDKAMNSVLLILLPSNWVLQDGKYVNTVQYSGFKSSDKLTVDLYDDGNLADLQLTEYEHYIDGFEIIDGALVAIASVKPTQTMTVVVKGGFQANESEVGDLSVIEDELNVLGNRPVNNNILINSNFKIPVNQREITGLTVSDENTYKYTIDRWIISRYIGAASTTFVYDMEYGGVVLVGDKSGDGVATFGQLIDYLPKGTYTFSAKINGKIYSHTFDYNQEDTFETGIVFENDGIGIGMNVTGCMHGNLHPFVWICVQSNMLEYALIEWAKLEEGSVATPYVPRSYWEEMLTCKKYFRHWYNTNLPANGDSNAIYSTHWFDDWNCGTRNTHSATLRFAEIYVNGTQASGFTSEIVNIYPNCIALKHTKTSHEISPSDVVEVNMSVALDSEL